MQGSVNVLSVDVTILLGGTIVYVSQDKSTTAQYVC